MDGSTESFARALGLILSGVELRLCAEAYGGSGTLDYAGLAADDFTAGYAIMDDALALT